MNKKRIQELLNQFVIPALLTVLGLILILNPDTAAALVVKILGWFFIVVGACAIIAAVLADPYERPKIIVLAVLSLGLGIFLVAFPMTLAKILGRFFGIFLVTRGGSNISVALHRKNEGFPYQYSLGIAIATLAAGILLIVLPLTLSRFVLNICGVVLVIIGICNILASLKEIKKLEDGADPNIIDADE